MNKEIFEFEHMQYVVRYPNNYQQSSKHPVIIHLHGAASRGNDINLVYSNAFFETVDEYQPDLPFLIFAPHCRTNTWFDILYLLKKFVLMIRERPDVDQQRIYLTGNSMGGYGVWQLAMSMPEIFAAIAPNCGGGMYWNAGCLVNVPVWAFHGGKDTVVYVEESEKMVDAINKRGGNAKLTINPEGGHGLMEPFKDPELYRWFLSHEKNANMQEIESLYKDINTYG